MNATPKKKRPTQPSSGPEPQVSPGRLADLIGFQLRRAHTRMAALLSQKMLETGLRNHQLASLVMIVDNPGLSQSALSQALGIERANFVDIVDDLEQRGFIVREPVPGDRRRFALQATPAGVELCDRVIEITRRHEAEVLGTWTDAQKARLLAALKKIP